MNPILGRFVEPIYALFRIVVGFTFSLHGAQKLFGAFGGAGGDGQPVPLMSLMGLAGVIEFGCGLLVLIGLFTSLAAFIASGQMAVAYFMAHFPHGVLPIVNHGESAVLFCFIFLYISARGSGIWSVDQALGRGTRPAAGFAPTGPAGRP